MSCEGPPQGGEQDLEKLWLAGTSSHTFKHSAEFHRSGPHASSCHKAALVLLDEQTPLLLAPLANPLATP
jgi:hypothetical protein